MDKKNQKDWDPNWDPKWCTKADLESPDEDIVCTCWDVSVGDLKKKVGLGLTNSEIQKKTGIGLSCGLCMNRFEYLVEEYRKFKNKI